jgi:thiosulfate/3-mercaptopyruvate sulfurtransferase
MLMDAVQLQRNLTNPAWVVFDCRHDLADLQWGARRYAESHIPGARFAPLETALCGTKTGANGRHPLPPAAQFAAFLSSQGVTPDTQVVAYDDCGGPFAARFWWLARWIGLTKVAVLDGGLSKWYGDRHPLTDELPKGGGRGHVVAHPNPAMQRVASQVLEGISCANCLIIDARAPERFRGEVEPIDPVAGHIPTAVNRPYMANLNPDHTMRRPEELRKEFGTLIGNRRPAQVVHQCGSGVTACANLLAMEHAGLPGSALYVGSWSEWCCDPKRPVAKGQ